MGTSFEKAAQYVSRKKQSRHSGQKPGNRSTPPLLKVLFAFSLMAMALTWADVIEWKDGLPNLKPTRKAQLEQDKKEIEEAEQYALIAWISGYYTCPLCPQKIFFLNKGEVWKYGVTRKGQRSRYSDKFLAKNELVYIVQFAGDYAQCLIREKVKLYEYPLLPENLARPEPLRLLLPPGNQQTK